MALAIFDLDKTLIGGDSDFLWGEFMSEIGAVDPKSYQAKNQYFFDQYALGKLDINEYLEFCLEPLSKNTLSTLNTWHQQFMHDKIEKILLPKAQAVIDEHKAKGDTILVITATNSFVTAPIVKRYGIDNLLATNPEMVNGGFTGKVEGEPCFQAGKIVHLNRWLEQTGESMSGAYFYSDSHNDLPMLELVDNPIVVHGDDKLLQIAKERNWLSLDWT
ncbi:Phosphoserine phosphatase (EC 3.1.3.3) [uncultured Gammaproteobacteria bacterium]|uniref:histidinol-phosphatase n=1 Tax=Bathymodiolus heckerae thiotrophic gill symbiont TaxID=1052212 RepID=UPI0010B0F667|nr:HAD family hydrolase [Bathymodiolus heckerae thiotrophic gill symbiont]CAC9582425.1 Phosphoserine phosphatase (EC 3.1.3.3) [uncultured Gammaproteobacteria bacterium]CAC9583176.1 Phosphoserine phosphatase (EC 3.1.3.3) [uncultured Gammaproteobacteria bacterium]CAC9953109.1 Phosphoserine phosphatase (EC 3.1.3.3) [uncultured Gammaproteobacteria bacterium]SHN89770.1 Phosphoserine phosphatase [Bathymodiolus heckerae thiotrophic gill symbiont]